MIGAFVVSIDLIHDAGYLCTRLRTDGEKATSGGKQVIKTTDKLEIAVEFVYSRKQKMENFYLKDDDGKLWVEVIIN